MSLTNPFHRTISGFRQGSDASTGWAIDQNGNANFAGKITVVDLTVSGTLTESSSSSGFLAGNGTAAAPSYSFASDPTTGFYRLSAGVIGVTSAGTNTMAFGTTLVLGATVNINWTSTNPSGTVDLTLTRDAANSLALRSGTNPQIFNVYNTYTDASNYERLSIGRITAFGNAFGVYSNALGTGTQRTLIIGGGAISFYQDQVGAGGTTWSFDRLTAEFTPATDNLYAIGDATHRASEIWIAGRLHTSQGADVTAANSITLGANGNTFSTTGTTAIQMITTTGWQVGDQITLVLPASGVINHNTTATGLTATILVVGSLGTYTATHANSTVFLTLCSNGAASATSPAWVVNGGKN